MSPRKSTTKQGYVPLKNTILKKTKIWAAIFLILSGCETVKPLKVQNTKHQSFLFNSDPTQTTEKVIDFLLEKNFEFIIMDYNVIVTGDKVYSLTIADQTREDKMDGYFIANCRSFECPTVSFGLAVQVTKTKVSIHYKNILPFPSKYAATPTFRLIKELEAFLKN